jgi:hypothetical protein
MMIQMMVGLTTMALTLPFALRIARRVQEALAI